MFKRIAFLLLPLFLCVQMTDTATAADYCECPDELAHAERQLRFDAVLDTYKTMGASIVLIKDGRIVDTFQYGYADREKKIPVGSDTYFRVASISKMVSAVAVMQLLEQGYFSLDQDIGEILGFPVVDPLFPNFPITLRQIMTHTASLLDTYHYKEATRQDGKIELLRHVLNGNYTYLDFSKWEPGSHVAYSNFGGGLLGSVIEETSACTVDEYMNWKVFFPLGIGGGYHVPCLPYGAMIAKIYNERSGSMTLDLNGQADEHFDAEPETAYVHTAGALNMTAEGLAKICIALAGDGSVYGVRILKPETVEMMREVQNGIGSVSCESGRGLNLNIVENRLVRGRRLYGHQGKAYGMICAAYFDPADQTGAILLTNGCDTATVDSIAKIARAVITLAYEFL